MKENEAEELTKDICLACKTRHKCDKNDCTMAEIVAEQLLDNNYHKTVWHKLTDNDYPRIYKHVLVITEDGQYYVLMLTNYGNWLYGDIEDGIKFYKDIVAWTELPKYEE